MRSCGQNFALPQGALFELVHLTAEQARHWQKLTGEPFKAPPSAQPALPLLLRVAS